ncbi:KedN5 family methylcobalamin-dependent radical SAM C-methyltransferase [Nocardia alni]|uniref:KedN5 family methylcobalamin-dependent radical SAM C-methyltransferase n=1 Tax=Nocardia alni TaxID=2815723 RepID=UPI001C24269D|nr:KedN5 family methylcobalamin-dependent radical SAM C-methyltransferase [Nocardia alni]
MTSSHEPSAQASATDRMRVFLVQQGVWDTPLESMPLACGYLKATALADERLRDGSQITIHNFRGGLSPYEMAVALFAGDIPDVLAFSVFGWNFQAAGALAETFKQLNPEGWVVFGGTHVSHQADRVFRLFPHVDVVVNGEGEFTFRELLLTRLQNACAPADLDAIQGISYRIGDGGIRTTEARPPCMELDLIPSPFLTGAIDMLDENGRFRYDVALMETNRGCPYKCAFCYWGGAVGQKVRAFSRERLHAELEFFGRLGVHTIVACDANFGLLPQDKQFIEDFIEVRDRHGFPRSLETSWAKNKSNTFYDIVRTMKRAGIRSSFTLALQTLDETTLDLMNRRNMKVNQWEGLVEWLQAEGLDCYAELIYGSPGETYDSFLRGYDKLAQKVSRIAVYPMLMLPNTDYMARKAELGIVSVRGDTDDFEYVLATGSVGFADMLRLRRFVFWARVIAENAVLRHIWPVLREFAPWPQSRVLASLDAWVDRTDEPAAALLRTGSKAGDLASIGAAITYLYSNPQAKQLLRRWWAEEIAPTLPEQAAPLVEEVFRYDMLTQPMVAAAEPGTRLPVVTIRGEEYFLRADVAWSYDVPAVLTELKEGKTPSLEPNPVTLHLYYRTGAENAVTTTNHETIMHFMGTPEETVKALAAVGTAGTPVGG